jgi:hypothetical protein
VETGVTFCKCWLADIVVEGAIYEPYIVGYCPIYSNLVMSLFFSYI